MWIKQNVNTRLFSSGKCGTALLATVPKIGVFSILVQIGPVTNVVCSSSRSDLSVAGLRPNPADIGSEVRTQEENDSTIGNCTN